MRPIAALGVLAFVVMVPTLARAQSADAERLFGEGIALMKEHKFDEACSRFAQSDKLDPGVGNELWLADCYERNGKLAAAYKQYGATEKLAASLHDDREAVAHKRASALLAKLPKLVATLEDANKVDVGADATTVSVVVEPLVQQSAKAAPAPEAAPPAPAFEAPDLPGRSPLRVAAPITVASGMVGLGLGTAFALAAQGNRNDSNTHHCPGQNTCDVEGARLRQNAVTEDVVSVVSFVAGGLLVASGVAMFLVAPATNSEKSVAFAPTVSPTFSGVVAQGRF